MNEHEWHPFSYDLKIHLGEINLASFELKVERKVFSLPQILAFSAAPPLPPAPGSEDGYLLANIPVACNERQVEKENGWLNYCVKSYIRSYIDMSGDFESYQAKFSGKTRSGIKRKVKKFAERAGGLDLRTYRTPQEIEAFFELARPVSAASYQERLLDCGLPSNQQYIDHAKAAAATDSVRAFLLFARNVPVSYLYCPIGQGVLQYAFLGYVPEFSKFSPGTVLQWLAMEELFAEQRYSAFDFTEGDSEHKRFFSTHQVPCSLQLILQPTWKHRALVSLHRAAEAGSTGTVRTLDRFGLKQRIKRWIRRAA